MELSKEAFLEWEAHPVTVEVRRVLADQIQAAKDMWASGNLMRQSPEETVRNEAGMMGRIAAYQSLIEFDHDEYLGSVREPGDNVLRVVK